MGDDVRSTLAAIARRWVEEGWRRGDGAIVDELHAPGFVDHDSGDRAPDNDGFREGIVRLYAAFPDFHAEVRDLVVEVAGTCAGAFPGGASPGGQQFRAEPSPCAGPPPARTVRHIWVPRPRTGEPPSRASRSSVLKTG